TDSVHPRYFSIEFISGVMLGVCLFVFSIIPFCFFFQAGGAVSTPPLPACTPPHPTAHAFQPTCGLLSGGGAR
ncbi:hypothetical protein, partial [Micromonospora sp.]|uniref:hypothetical protein n=1 Tax=Micromonospora sp. TaxID=1876 RepID=UPI003B3ABDD2